MSCLPQISVECFFNRPPSCAIIDISYADIFVIGRVFSLSTKKALGKNTQCYVKSSTRPMKYLQKWYKHIFLSNLK